MINSFWMGPPPIDDLAKIQEYIRAPAPPELLGFLAPRAPLPPSAEAQEPQQLTPPKDLDELLATGLTEEDFALLAANEPEQWNDEELERIHAVLSGDAKSKSLSDLILEYMRNGGRGPGRPAKLPIQITSAPKEEEDPSSDHLEEPRPLPSFSVPGTVDVGDWWEAKNKP